MKRLLILCATVGLSVGCASKVSPPTATVSVVGGLTSVMTGALVQVDGSKSSDPQGLPLTFRWWLQNVPAGSTAKLDSTTIESPSFVADKTGAYVVALVVSDTVFPSATVTLTINAEPCGGHSPTITSIAFAQGTTTETDTFGATTSGAADGGSTDAGSTDAGETDAGPSDAGSKDGGASADAGPALDAGSVDGGATDGGSGGPLFRQLEAVQLSATVTDVDTDPTQCASAAPAVFTFNWSLQPPTGSTATLSSSTGTSPTFTPDIAGDYVVALTATDMNGHTGPAESSVLTVAACGDHAPQVKLSASSAAATVNGVAFGSSPAATLNSPITLTALAYDPDNGVVPMTELNCDPTGTNQQAVTVGWTFFSLPFGSQASIDVLPGNPQSIVPGQAVRSTAVFTPDVPGVYLIRLTATDPTHLSAQASVISITLGGCFGDHPPAVGAVQAVDGNGAPLPTGANGSPQATVAQAIQLEPTVTDADNSDCSPPQTFTYAWLITGLPAASHATLNDATLASPGLVPDVPGQYSVQLIATDSTGLASLPFTFGFTALAQTARAPSVQFNSGLTSLAFTPATGTSPATFSGAQVGDAVGLNLAGCNGSQAQLTDPANTVGSICTGNYGPLTFKYAWTILSAPAGSAAPLLHPTTINPSFIPDVEGTFSIQVVVTDSAGLASAPATVNVAVGCGASVKPTVSVSTNPGGTVNVGVPVWLIAAVTNVDAQGYTNSVNGTRVCSSPESFTYAWSILSAPAGSVAALNSTSERTPSFTPDVATGAWFFQVVVTDLQGRSSSATVEVTSSVCGAQAPHINSLTGNAVLNTYGGALTGGDPTATWDGNGNVTGGSPIYQPGTPITFDASVTDPNAACGAPAQTVTYAWSLTNLPAGSAAQVVSSGSTASLTPDVPSASQSTKDYELTLTVTNSSGHSATTVYGFTVSNCGAFTPIAVNSLINFNTPGGVGQTINLSVNSPGNNVSDGNVSSCFPSQFRLPATYGYRWTLASKPASSLSALQGASTGAASVLADVAGTYAVSLVVTDASGATSSVNSSSLVNVTVGACGSEAPAAVIGETDCNAPGPDTICYDVQNAPSSGGAPYAVCTTTNSGCLAEASTYTVTLALGHNYLLGSLTPPANFGCDSGDTWATMTYDWQVVSAPANASGNELQKTTTAGALFTPDRTGTYVVSLTVTNVLGRTSVTSVAIVAQ